MLKIIDFSSIQPFQTGHAQSGATGCTVVLCPSGAAAGVDVRGGGPAARETTLAHPLSAATALHGVLLSGGSAFALGAADGAMRFLAERGVGTPVGPLRVPLVCQSCIFDLGFSVSDLGFSGTEAGAGDELNTDAASCAGSSARFNTNAGSGAAPAAAPSWVDWIFDHQCAIPTAEMAYAACVNAQGSSRIPQGNVGVGAGATVGKLRGMEFAQKSGVGHFAMRLGELEVGALVVVNAIGDVFSAAGQRIGGMQGGDSLQDLYTLELLRQQTAGGEKTVGGQSFSTTCSPPDYPGNTTLGVIITNAKLDKTAMNKVAAMAQNALARRISPVHLSMDGDTVYALACGGVEASSDVVGTLAAEVLATAIENAVRETHPK